MTKNEKIEVNKKIKEVFALIDKKQFEKAESILDLLEKYNNKKVRWVREYVTEYKYYHSIENTEKGRMIFEYLKRGNLSLNNKDYNTALEYFKEGLKLTKDPLFKYYIGVCYFNMENYEEAQNKFQSYSADACLKQEESYYYLTEIYDKLTEKKRNDFEKTRKAKQKADIYYSKYKQIKQIKSGNIINVEKTTKNIDLDDEEIKELISKHKINDVVNIFNIASYQRKVTMLALLYKNGFASTADKLLKTYGNKIKENAPEEFSKLNKNKKLYLMQAKQVNS